MSSWDPVGLQEVVSDYLDEVDGSKPTGDADPKNEEDPATKPPEDGNPKNEEEPEAERSDISTLLNEEAKRHQDSFEERFKKPDSVTPADVGKWRDRDQGDGTTLRTYADGGWARFRRTRDDEEQDYAKQQEEKKAAEKEQEKPEAQEKSPGGDAHPASATPGEVTVSVTKNPDAAPGGPTVSVSKNPNAPGGGPTEPSFKPGSGEDKEESASGILGGLLNSVKDKATEFKADNDAKLAEDFSPEAMQAQEDRIAEDASRIGAGEEPLAGGAGSANVEGTKRVRIILSFHFLIGCTPPESLKLWGGGARLIICL
jgi:hypothetical protein